MLRMEDYDYLLKILVVGNSGVGKSSLLGIYLNLFLESILFTYNSYVYCDRY